MTDSLQRGLPMVLALGLVLAAQAAAQTFTTLYSFTDSPDGSIPVAALLEDKVGNLYGTTVYGGAGTYGTIFKLNTSGAETVLHSFLGTDGEYSEAPLVRDSIGNLYGTAHGGGAYNYGSVFRIDTAGTETTLHSFAGGTSDGCSPLQGLVGDQSGNLYGTTYGCGAYGGGTVFKLDRAGKITVLHSFAGGRSDGDLPEGGHLVRDKSGNLYGVTYGGGSNGCFNNGCGVLYKLGSNGTWTILHKFSGGISDGCFPYGTVAIDEAGSLYGTTWSCGAPGNGIVWRVSKAGKETVLHSFAGGVSDGCNPYASVVRDSHGNLYGTTMGCGAHNSGTVFKVDSGGRVTVLHSFAGDAEDGAIPYGEVLRTSSGKLFGTASSGGSSGWGTVWSYVP
jgi:uncharacterized repeat protein (TIGR03803 family)